MIFDWLIPFFRQKLKPKMPPLPSFIHTRKIFGKLCQLGHSSTLPVLRYDQKQAILKFVWDSALLWLAASLASTQNVKLRQHLTLDVVYILFLLLTLAKLLKMLVMDLTQSSKNHRCWLVLNSWITYPKVRDNLNKLIWFLARFSCFVLVKASS